MIDFLLKSTISLSVFLGFYLLVLEREKIHQFNRFYLLFSIVISFIIPFISYRVSEEIPFTKVVLLASSIESIKTNSSINYIPLVFWVIYFFITSFFLIRYFKNILSFISKHQTNKTVKFKKATLVLIEQEIIPHTFLNSIFINKKEYESQQIEHEIYVHELAHVNEKHTYDLLFIELVNCIFWFNPIFILYKKSIQLNHEFIADQNVINSIQNISYYQNLLLKKSNSKTSIYLASNLNYLITKKRLIMMTKKTSKIKTTVIKMGTLPLFIGLLFCLSIKISAQEINNSYQDNTKNISEIDEQPEFIGGISSFYKYIGQNYIIPNEFSNSKTEGIVYIQFTIETDGSITNVNILKDLGYGTGKEAKRVIENSPKWKPGKIKGKSVRVEYKLPISLKSN